MFDSSNNNEVIVYNYKFILENNVEKEFKVLLNKDTLNLIQKKHKRVYPEWAKLSFCKCPNCSLDENQYRVCPVAGNLIEIFDFFSDFKSHDKIDIIIETAARKYIKCVTLQKGLSSLIGLCMAASDCSIMAKLKPMIPYHLPFATQEETKYRVISMYLLAQYFLFKRGKEPDWELKKLVKIYNDIQILNKSFCKRIWAIQSKDANINALVVLDCFADFVSISINENMMEEIKVLFNTYFEEK
ncbi:hypothetical protein KAI68_04905 [bacterium]|nr:hypothetical protein [bacterium]